MSKKHYLDQNKISQYLFDDYIFNRELSSSDDILKHVNLLIDNNLASKITGTEDLLYVNVSKYKIASKFMCKYNKSLTKFKRTTEDLEDSMDFVFADTPAEIIELSKYGLDAGIYYAYLGKKKHDDYAVMKVYYPEVNDPTYITFELYFIGYNHLKFKDKFFKIYDKYRKLKKEIKQEGITYCDGRPYKETKFKGFDKMIFHDKDNIINYINNWVDNIPNYYKYGMSPKLSILLYGEPGTGKSTFTKAVAKHLDIENIMIVSPDYFSDTDPKKRSVIRTGRYSSYVFALDDIDCVCNSREDDQSNENGQILSTLLEFLDNPPTFYYKAKDGLYYPISIVIATTNYIDKLDDAVKRYGRFDLKIKMSNCNRKQAEAMCTIYDLSLKDVYKEPINNDFSISPSYLQALCLENIDKGIKNKGVE